MEKYKSLQEIRHPILKDLIVPKGSIFYSDDKLSGGQIYYQRDVNVYFTNSDNFKDKEWFEKVNDYND